LWKSTTGEQDSCPLPNITDMFCKISRLNAHLSKPLDDDDEDDNNNNKTKIIMNYTIPFICYYTEIW
jgi:hypothetical protein